MRTPLKSLAIAVVLSSTPSHAASVVSDWGRIILIKTGFVVDSMAVFTQAPRANPGCPVTNDGYATNPNDSGHQLHHSVLLAAFISGKEVQILAEDCVFSKPRIIGVNVR